MNDETFMSNSTSMHKTASTRNGRQIDLSSAASGYGGGYCCDTGVDLPTLLALLAGILSIFTKKKSQISIDFIKVVMTILLYYIIVIGIALATYFLRIQIIVLMRGKRDTRNDEGQDVRHV